MEISPVTIEFTDRELALVIAGLAELPAKLSHGLLTRLEAVAKEALEQQNKMPGPDLKMVSAG